MYTVLLLSFTIISCAMDYSKIPFTQPWTKKRVTIMAVLDKNCKLSLPYEPQVSDSRTIKKPILIKAKL